MLVFNHGVSNEPDENRNSCGSPRGRSGANLTRRLDGRTVDGTALVRHGDTAGAALRGLTEPVTAVPRLPGRAAVTTGPPSASFSGHGLQAGRRRKASPPPAALPARGGDPPEPPMPSGPRDSVTRAAALARGSDPRNRRRAGQPANQVWPSNRLVTDPSLKTSWMARAMSGAIDSTVSLSNRFSGGMGRVLVTMTSPIREFFS